LLVFVGQSSYFVPFKKSFDYFLSHTHCCKRTGAGERLEQIAGVSSQANVNTSSSHGVVKVLDLFVFKEVD